MSLENVQVFFLHVFDVKCIELIILGFYDRIVTVLDVKIRNDVSPT